VAPGQGKRFHAQVYADAVNLYATGKSIADVCRELKLKNSTVQKWMAGKYPEDWTKARERFAQSLAEKVEKKAVETAADAVIRRKKVLAVAGQAMAKKLADHWNEIPPSVAATQLPKIIRAEREEDITIERIMEIENRTMGVGIAAGAQAADGSKAGIMAFLTETFNEVHKNDEPTTIENSESERPPTENS
jgi:hypothetical protein